MLELIRHWLVGITCAAMLVALAESLIPAGSIRRIARLTGGLVLLAAILNPLLKLDTTALTRALTEYKLELSAYSADLEEENEILMKDIIEEQSGKNHKTGDKPRKRKRNLRQTAFVNETMESNVKNLIPYKK